MDYRFSHGLLDLLEPVSRYIQVPAAVPFTRILKSTPITPNQVTFISVLFALGGAYAFSRGTLNAMILGGLLFEFSLILDCVDGQLARAKGMSSEWGRLIDGIGDYVSGLAVLAGLMIGFPDTIPWLAALAVLIFLRGISYDYYKEKTNTLINKGYDGSLRDIHTTFKKIQTQPSMIQKIYFYYLQIQQWLFNGQWTSLMSYEKKDVPDFSKNPWTKTEREEYRQRHQFLMVVWKWNGPDLAFFIICLFAILGILDHMLPGITCFIAAQFILTFAIHHYQIRNEKHP